MKRPQISIMTLLLFTAAVSVWTMIVILKAKADHLNANFKSLSTDLGAVLVSDDDSLAVGMIESAVAYRYWSDERYSWSVFVPRSGMRLSYTIKTNTGPSVATDCERSVLLEPGYHSVVVEYGRKNTPSCAVLILLDGAVALESKPETEHAGQYFPVYDNLLFTCSPDNPLVTSPTQELELIALYSSEFLRVQESKSISVKLEPAGDDP